MSRSNLVPLWIDWSGQTVLVVGLGSVGQRRSLAFQEAGATVVGIDPLPKNHGSTWGELIRGGLELRCEPYHAALYDELAEIGLRPGLVLAAATPEVNRRVIADARARGLWVNSATADQQCHANVHLGAVAAGQHVSVAVHSGNVAPALSAMVRDSIEKHQLPAADRLAALAAHWRERILTELSDANKRREILALFGSPEIYELEKSEPGAGVHKIEEMMHHYLN